MSLKDEIKAEFLKSIHLTGGIESGESSPLIATRLQANSNILNLSSGIPSIRRNQIPKFKLILSQPLHLAALSSLEIRCCLCSKVISYPAWFYSIQFTVNQFNYFICFSGENPTKVNTDCLTRR